MDEIQIEQLKTEIKAEYEPKIKKLIEDMEAELAAVSRIEARLRRFCPVQQNETAQAVQYPEPRRTGLFKLIDIGIKTPSAPIRIKAAIEKTSGDFTSADILQAANNDGTGKEIPRNTFFPVFSKLLNEENKTITTVREQKGNQPGVYRKVSKETLLAESSQASDLESLSKDLEIS